MLRRLLLVIALITPLTGCLWAVVTTPVIMGGKAIYNETMVDTQEAKLDLRPWWFQLYDNFFGKEEESSPQKA